MFRKTIRLGALAGLLVLAASAPAVERAGGQNAEVPTAADLGALPMFADPAISPDGRNILARGYLNGKQLVLIMEATGADPAVRQIRVPDNHQLEWLRWAGNGRILLSLSRADKFMKQEVRVTRLVAHDLARGTWLQLGPRTQGIDGDDLVHVDREGRFALLSTQGTIYDYPSVYRIDLVTGAQDKIVPAQTHVWAWFADQDGVVRAGLGASGDKWWLVYRGSGTEPFKRTARSARDSETIDQFVPAIGGDQGYTIASSAGGRFALFRYDFKADRIGELLYENPAVDIESFTLGSDGALLGVQYVDDRPEIVWFDPEFKKLQARLDRALPGAVNRVVSFSTDRSRILVWSASATQPGTYYFYDRKTNRMAAFAQPYDRLAGKRLAPMEPVRYAARDGLEIRGYLTLPPGRDPRGLPLVVMPHGGPFARDQWGYEPWVQYLAAKGYAVLQPNFRGSTGFGRGFVEKGAGQWGRGMQDDIDDGVKWLAGKGTVDAKRVCIMGASFGGYAAMWAAVRNPELYRCAISFAGISDVSAMLRYDRKAFTAPRYFRDWRERVQGDKDFALDAISPIKAVERLAVPILIGHGEKDDNVPLIQSRRLHEALTRLGRTHEYVAYPGEGHGFADPKNSTDFLNRVGAFLDRHNPS